MHGVDAVTKLIFPLFRLSDTLTKFSNRRTEVIVSFVCLVTVAVTAMNGILLGTVETVTYNHLLKAIASLLFEVHPEQ